jgi:hypothetical protein
MRIFRFSISNLLLVTAVTALCLLPVNRNTAKQIWYSIDTKNAPSGGAFISGGGARHDFPFDYGDTWFSRFRKLQTWINPPPTQFMIVTPRIIIEEEEEVIFRNAADETAE